LFTFIALTHFAKVHNRNCTGRVTLPVTVVVPSAWDA
jgi:hypothetical protein